MKTLFLVLHLSLLTLLPQFKVTGRPLPDDEVQLKGKRFLTFNAVIRVNQIEVSRDRNVGEDERSLHTPERVAKFRKAIESGFPGAKITWALSWLALHDKTPDYVKIRELVVNYHQKYGDDITFIPGAYFANAYNSTDQVNKDLHEGLAKVSEIVGNGFRPKSVVAGFLSSANQKYLAEKEGIHVCQGNIWSQYAIDNQDGDGSVSYPFYPSKEHFCKPAQGKSDFVDCVNLDGWTVDFLAGRREGFAEGFNSRMGVGPIETLGKYGFKTGVLEMIHTTAIHFDKGFELNGFAWVTNCWEVSLQIDVTGLTEWLSQIKKSWPDVKFITQGEFGLLWRSQYKSNDFNYRFEETGSGIGGSDKEKEIRWFMNKDFRLALLRNASDKSDEKVIDFSNYRIPAKEPSEMTRRWSLMGEINQKQTRPQDKPVPLTELSDEARSLITKHYPRLISLPANILPVRGLCIAAPQTREVDAFVKFIDEELAPRTVNTLILRVDFNFQYNSHPELRDSIALSEEDVMKLVAVCRKNGIRIIPQVNLLGHQSWAGEIGNLLKVYPELDETPNVKMPEKYVWPNADGLYCKSYCPLHPDVHSIVFDLVDEICDVFKTDAFHAGMDEVFYIGEAQCPRCSGRDKAELFAGEVRTIRDHLALKNRKLWIWGDRLLDGKTTGLGEWEASYNNTHRAIDMIPKDVIICDWHYERPDQTPVYFAMKGLSVVTCPWRMPGNAVLQTQDMIRWRNYATPEMKERYQGMIQTVWSGAGQFMDSYYGKRPDSDENSPVKCFKALYTEIQKSSELK